MDYGNAKLYLVAALLILNLGRLAWKLFISKKRKDPKTTLKVPAHLSVRLLN